MTTSLEPPRRLRTSLLMLAPSVLCWAMAALAADLEDGQAAIDAGEYARGIELLMPLAEGGDPLAQNAVGVLYMNGWGVEQDYERGVDWFRRAAEQEEPMGITNLACAYRDGTGVERSCQQARKILLDCAKRGEPRCQVDLGELLASGCPDLQANPAEGFRWSKAAAEQGDPLALGNIGACYALGYGVRQDFSKAIHWYERAAAAGNTLAAYNLAGMYERGEGTGVDMAGARHWYETAAAGGHRAARLRLELLDEEPDPAPAFDPAALHFALNAPAEAVIMPYAAMKMTEQFLPLVEAGTTLHLGEEKITKENVGEFRRQLEAQIRAIALAIDKRRAAQISGTYRAVAPDCSRSGSMWAAVISEGFDEVLITQEGEAVTLEARGTHEGEFMEFPAQGYIIENTLAFLDPANSDYPLTGEVENAGRIRIRPIVDLVLQAWPAWANPPAREDVESCVVTLERVP